MAFLCILIISSYSCYHSFLNEWPKWPRNISQTSYYLLHVYLLSIFLYYSFIHAIFVFGSMLWSLHTTPSYSFLLVLSNKHHISTALFRHSRPLCSYSSFYYHPVISYDSTFYLQVLALHIFFSGPLPPSFLLPSSWQGADGVFGLNTWHEYCPFCDNCIDGTQNDIQRTITVILMTKWWCFAGCAPVHLHKTLLGFIYVNFFDTVALWQSQFFLSEANFKVLKSYLNLLHYYCAVTLEGTFSFLFFLKTNSTLTQDRQYRKTQWVECSLD